MRCLIIIDGSFLKKSFFRNQNASRLGALYKASLRKGCIIFVDAMYLFSFWERVFFMACVDFCLFVSQRMRMRFRTSLDRSPAAFKTVQRKPWGSTREDPMFYCCSMMLEMVSFWSRLGHASLFVNVHPLWQERHMFIPRIMPTLL